jgi:hypothetical protein
MNMKRIQDQSICSYICDSTCKYQSQFGDCHVECVICLEESLDTEKLITLPCRHTFHEHCVLPWLEKHNSCPTCRYELQHSDTELERKRIDQLMDQYGDLGFKLLQMSAVITKLYSEYQCMQTRSQKKASLKNIDNIMNKVYSTDILKNLKSNELLVDDGSEWTKQMLKEILARIHYLEHLVDSTKQAQKDLPNQCCTLM